ncbi:MAG: hypothetical protein ACYSTT_01965, partial [Planctomycetota bacterium]
MKTISRWSKVIKQIWLVAVAGGLISVIITPSTSHAYIIGLDARNGMYESTIFATGDKYDTF